MLTSGAINSALPTGDAKSGSDWTVRIEMPPPLRLRPLWTSFDIGLLAKSKSQSFTGEIRSGSVHKTFSKSKNVYDIMGHVRFGELISV